LPTDSTLVNPGGGPESSSWTGMPIIDIRYQPDEGRVTVVLEDDFLAFLQRNRFIGDETVFAAGEDPVHHHQPVRSLGRG
jgi:hypothetical protein